MACTSSFLKNITTSCGSNIPSIKRLIVGKFGAATFTYAYLQEGGQDVLDADGNKIIENISGATLAGTDKFVEFSFKKNTSSMDSELTVNDNGSHYFTNTINCVFAKEDTVKRLALEAVASGDTTAIVLDGNNQWWVIGDRDEVSMTTLTATTGTAVSDANGYTVAIANTSANMPIQLVGSGSTTVESIISTLLGQ